MSNKRQLIFDQVKARFATITTANGYPSNVGQKIFEWQTTTVDKASLPCTLLSDPVETASEGESKNAGLLTRHLEIEASLLLAEANQTAAKARAALEDVIKAIGTDQKWNNLARRTVPVSDELKLDDEGLRISGVRMRFNIEYGRVPWEA